MSREGLLGGVAQNCEVLSGGFAWVRAGSKRSITKLILVANSPVGLVRAWIWACSLPISPGKRVHMGALWLRIAPNWGQTTIRT